MTNCGVAFFSGVGVKGGFVECLVEEMKIASTRLRILAKQ